MGIAILLTAPCYGLDQKLVERLDLSTTAFSELMQSADAKIPKNLLMKSEAIVIFPRTINVAWGLGGEFGKGVALCREKKTGRWSNPAFYTLGGVSLGPQIGGQAVDIILVVMNEKGLSSLLKSHCTLGGDAGIAVGPAGRNATASTDIRAGAEIYSYSRAKGLYIGLSLKGAVVTPDEDANAKYYGANLTAKEILLENKGADKPYHQALLKTIRRYAPPRAIPWIVPVWGTVLLGGVVLIAASVLRKKMK